MIEEIWGEQAEVTSGRARRAGQLSPEQDRCAFPRKVAAYREGQRLSAAGERTGPAGKPATGTKAESKSNETAAHSSSLDLVVLRDVRDRRRAVERVELVDAAAEPDGDRVPRAAGAGRRCAAAADRAWPPCRRLTFLQQKFGEIYQVKDDGKYLQILDQDGNWLYRSKRMIDEGLRPAAARRPAAAGDDG